MTTIALVDTRLEIPGESIGTVVSTHDTIAAAFKGNEAFQIRMRGRLKVLHPDENRELKVRLGLGDGEHVRPSLHLA